MPGGRLPSLRNSGITAQQYHCAVQVSINLTGSETRRLFNIGGEVKVTARRQQGMLQLCSAAVRVRGVT